MRITDDDYHIPLVEALAYHQTFNTGANKPLLITGVDQQGNKGDYVVKFRSADRMSEEACMRELMALFLATQMGIPCVQPAIVNISEPFVGLLVGNDACLPASKSIGYNAGSRYVPDYKTLLIGQPLNDHEIPAALQIFAFDLIIQNTDRRNDKPNMMSNGRELLVYDHELAFSFALDIFPNPKPWEIREQDMHWVNQHTLLQRIRGKAFNYDELSQRFDTLDGEFWTKAWQLLPIDWRLGQFDSIRSHVDAICTHKDSFILELKKLLA